MAKGERIKDILLGLLEEAIERGVHLGAAAGAFDPKIRPRAEEFAFWLREHLNYDGKINLEILESAWGAFRGGLERMIEEGLPSPALKVIAEKILIDIPDFAAGVMFSDIEQFNIRRAARARKLIHDGELTTDQMEEVEELIEDLYKAHEVVMHEVADEQIPLAVSLEERRSRWEWFKKMLRGPYGPDDETLAQVVHTKAVSLRNAFFKGIDDLDAWLLEHSSIVIDPELQERMDALDEEERRLKSRRIDLQYIEIRAEQVARRRAQVREQEGRLREMGLEVPSEVEEQ